MVIFRFNGFFMVAANPPPTNLSFHCNLSRQNITEGTVSNYGTVSVWEAGSKMGDVYLRENSDGDTVIYNETKESDHYRPRV